MSEKNMMKVLVLFVLAAAVGWTISKFGPLAYAKLSDKTEQRPALGCVGGPYEFHDTAEAAKAFQETAHMQCRMEAWEFLSTSTDKPAPTFEYWQSACVQAKQMTNPEVLVPKLADMMKTTAETFAELLQAMCCDPSRERGAELRDYISQQASDFDDWQGVMTTVHNATCSGSDDDNSPWNLYRKELMNMAERGMAVHAKTAKEWLFLAILSDKEKSADYAVRALRVAGSFDDYYEVAELLKKSNEVRMISIMSLAMIGMDRTAATFEERYSCIQAAQRWYSLNEIYAMADQLADLAVSLNEWVLVHHFAAPNSSTERRAKAAIVEMAKTEQDWFAVAADVNLRKLAHEKLKALADKSALPAEAAP